MRLDITWAISASAISTENDNAINLNQSEIANIIIS